MAVTLKRSEGVIRVKYLCSSGHQVCNTKVYRHLYINMNIIFNIYIYIYIYIRIYIYIYIYIYIDLAFCSSEVEAFPAVERPRDGYRVRSLRLGESHPGETISTCKGVPASLGLDAMCTPENIFNLCLPWVHRGTLND